MHCYIQSLFPSPGHEYEGSSRTGRDSATGMGPQVRKALRPVFDVRGYQRTTAGTPLGETSPENEVEIENGNSNLGQCWKIPHLDGLLQKGARQAK